jgi:hypothetical protein
MEKLTDKQAYAAMFHFLERIYLRTQSDELGGLLGSMSVLKDGSTADPAILRDWNEAVEYALSGYKPAQLKLKE